jgi:hypothetical protein
MELDYEKIYNVYNRIPWYLKNDSFGLGTAFFIREYDTRFNNELEVEFKKLFPRRKKFDPTKLSEDIVEPIRKKYQDIALSNFKAKLKQITLLRKLLNTLANEIVIIPSEELHKLKVSSASTYSSQGWGANKYAREALNDEVLILEKQGYRYEVRKELSWDAPDCPWYNYQLWANITEWQFDCILRKTDFDELQWAIDCWKKGVNPKVYNPFLSNDIYDRSLELWNE